MKNLIKTISIVSFTLLIFTTFSFNKKTAKISNAQKDQSNKWEVPEHFKIKKNLMERSEENFVTGRVLYAKHCKSCHGNSGNADGVKASKLELPPAEFVIESFQNQSDGEIFYKLSEGRGDMGSYKKMIGNEDDRWILVNYIRTFASK